MKPSGIDRRFLIFKTSGMFQETRIRHIAVITRSQEFAGLRILDNPDAAKHDQAFWEAEGDATGFSESITIF